MRLSHSIMALLIAASAPAVNPSAIHKAESFGIMHNPAGVLDALDLWQAGDGATAAWTEAKALYDDARFRAATIAMARFTEMYPDSPYADAARAVRAECFMAEGDTDAALEIFRSVNTAGMTSALASAVHYGTGVCLIQKGETAAGLKELEKADSGDAAVRAAYVRACIALNDGDTDMARRLLPSATDVIPYGILDATGARIEFLSGMYAPALDKGRRALASGQLDKAQTLETSRIVGLSMIRTGAGREGVEILRRYLADGGDDAAALLAVGKDDYTARRYDDAADLLRRAATAPGETGQYASLYLGQTLEALGDIDGAIPAFDAASRPAGSEAARTARFNAAVLSVRGRGMPFKSAATAFEDFLREYPDGLYTDRVRRYLALGYLTENDYSTALERIEAVRHKTPEILEAEKEILYRLGLSRLDASEASQARSALDRAAAIRTSGTAALDAEITLARGRAAQLAGDNAGAVTEYDRYLRTAPRNAANIAKAHYYKGYARYGQRLYADADREFEAAQESGTFTGAELADILNRRGDISYYAQVFGPAREYYAAAHRANPAGGDYAMYSQARMAGYERDYNAKLSLIDNFLTSYPSSPLVPEAMMEKTQALISLNRNDEAVAVFTQIAERYPRSAQGRRAMLQKGLTLADAGRSADAAATYRKLISEYPSSSEARQASMLLRRIYADQGRGNEYIAFMESVEGAPQVERDDAATLVFESARHSFGNDGGAAMRSFLERYPDASETEQAMAMLAQLDFEQGRVPEALEQWQSLAAKSSDVTTSTTALLGIIRAARRMGRNEQAGQAAKTVLESSAARISQADIAEAAYSAGAYERERGNNSAAVEYWDRVASNTDDLYGVRCAYAAAESFFADGDRNEALRRARDITGSRSPHRYWVARAFILQADILTAQDKKFEARQYLEALRSNYPGTEADIQDMIDQRLNTLSE